MTALQDKRSFSDINVLPALAKCSALGFLAGFLTSSGPAANGLLPLAVLMVFISAVLVLFEVTDLEAATSVAVVAV